MDLDCLAIPGYFRGISPPSNGQKRKKREKEYLEKDEGCFGFMLVILFVITS